MSYNNVTLLGYLGRDAEIRHTQNGDAVANLSVATKDRYKKDGEWKDRTEWHRVVVFGKQAEFELQKGMQIFVTGRLQTRKWSNKAGEDQYTTEIVAEMIRTMGSSSTRSEDDEERPARKTPPKQAPANELNDEIPF